MAEYLEQDYQRIVKDVGPTHFLPGTGIEIIREVDLTQPSRPRRFGGLHPCDGGLCGVDKAGILFAKGLDEPLLRLASEYAVRSRP